MARSLAAKDAVSARMRSIRRVLWAILFLNLAVAAAKYFYGLASGSASMQADGIHSVFDSAGNVVGLVGIALAARPADEGHPYGHAKFETYASLVIGVLLLLAAFEVGSGAVGRLATGTFTASVTPASFVVMVGTLCVHVGVTLVSLGFPAADPVMALVVTAAILVTAFDVFKHALATLSDKARIPEEDLRATALEVEGVRDVHRIRTRGTEGEVYADLHVLVAPEMTVGKAHRLADAVEAAVQRRFPNVIEVLVHIEPDDGHTE